MPHILGDVSEVMSSPVITVSPDQSLSTTTQRLLNEEVGSIVVTTETLELEGIVTKTDLLEGYARCETPSEQPISDMMSTSVVTIEPDRPLSTAARRLDNNGIKHLVVVDDSVTSGVIVEVVDAGDFVLGFLSDCVVKADEATL